MIPDNWPLAQYSETISVRPYQWHLQQFGKGPTILMLHGAAASTHSFRSLAPLLASGGHRLMMVDLPGHGHTKGRGRFRLEQMSQDIARLLDHQGVTPHIVVGHSAGAAIGARLALDRPEIAGFVSINGAFEMFDGAATWLFPLLAKALALNPLTAPIFARTMTLRRTGELLRGTGSDIDAEGVALYHQLITQRSHVDGTLKMMANWSLDRLNRDLSSLRTPTLLLAGAKDQAIAPRVSDDLDKRLENATLITEPDLGHLMHEEAPERVAAHVQRFLTGLTNPKR